MEPEDFIPGRGGPSLSLTQPGSGGESWGLSRGTLTVGCVQGRHAEGTQRGCTGR